MALNLNNLTQDQQFASAAEFAGVPESVLRGMWRTESSEGRNLTSEAGARGHFQTMPATQATWEKRTGKQYNPDDFADSLTLAALTMRENMALGKGNVDMALKIYHGGTNPANWGERTNSYGAKVQGTNAAMAGGNTGYTLRGVSFDEAWKGVPFGGADALLNQKSKEYLSDFEKGVVNQVGVEAGSSATLAGDPNAAVVSAQYSAAAKSNLAASTSAYIEEMKGAGGPEATAEVTTRDIQRAADRAVEQQQFAEAQGLSDYWGASFSSTLTGQAMRMYENMDSDRGYEAGWRYIDHINDIETPDMTARERAMLREASSPSEVEFYKQEIQQLRYDSRVLGTMGTAGQVTWGLTAGVTDPLGWVAGLGVGKAASLVGVGARSFIAAGRPVAALAAGAGEGAVGNLFAGATLDAMGAYRTSGDYIQDAGMGLLFGSALSIPGVKAARDTAIELHNIGAQRRASTAIRAQEMAGPNATPDQVTAAIRTVEAQDDLRFQQEMLGDIPDAERLTARPDVDARAEATSVFSRSKDRKALEDRYSLKSRIPDNTTRLQVAEILGRAERILASNPIDPQRLATILQRADLEATSTTMLNSKSPVARAAGIMLMENPEGAAGRRSTASLSRSQFFEQYMGTTNRDAHTAYEMWAKEQQVGSLRANLDGDMQSRFYREVSAEMDRRWNKITGQADPHPMVKLAADVFDVGYRRMGKDQKHVGVVGAERIDLETSGYFQRMWNIGKVAEYDRTPGGHKALVDMLEDQFRTVAKFGGDDFPRELAETYLQRLVHRAAGTQEVPAHLYSDDTAAILRDSLTALRLNEAEIQKVVSRFSRGGAGHTKGRIDMDLSKQYDDGAGNKFSALDFMDHNLPELYRRYAGRVAGDVALAKHGILGDAGVRTLREAMVHTGATAKELRAYDQFMSEMTGRKFGDGDPTILANARVLTGAARLGGAAFPQVGGWIDGMIAVGVGRVLKTIGDVPRLFGEVRALQRGEKIDNPIIGSIETLGGAGAEFGLSDYRISGMFDVADRMDVYGRESIGVMSRAIRGSGNAVRIMSGHRAMVGVQTRGMAEQIVQKAWRYIRDGGEDKALADMGFNPKMQESLRQYMDQVVEFDDVGNLKVFDPRRVEDSGVQLMIAFRDAVYRGAGQIIQREFPGETGKWAHSGLLKMLFQFRTFSLVAHQKQLGRNFGVHGTSKALGYLLGGMSLAMPIHAARVMLRSSALPDAEREKFLDEQLSPIALARATMNYVGTLGLMPDVLDVGGGFAAGWADTAGVDLPQWMKSTGGRTMAQSDVIGGQFAPAVGLVNDMGQGVFGNPGKLVRTMPGSNLPYLQPLILGAEAELKD